jgi:hypothetical protein
MAQILVRSAVCEVNLLEPDEDGDYRWLAACGAEGDAYRPLDEAVADAENHVDIQCAKKPVIHLDGCEPEGKGWTRVTLLTALDRDGEMCPQTEYMRDELFADEEVWIEGAAE